MHLIYPLLTVSANFIRFYKQMPEETIILLNMHADPDTAESLVSIHNPMCIDTTIIHNVMSASTSDPDLQRKQKRKTSAPLSSCFKPLIILRGEFYMTLSVSNNS